MRKSFHFYFFRLYRLIEIVGDVSLGRINRISTAYAGIVSLILFMHGQTLNDIS